MGRKAVDSNQVFIDGLDVPVEDRIGEEGRGFEYILHGMNPERILIAAEAIGLGRAALRARSGIRKERIVFDRPIGQNQAIQHPLAECWMELEAAELRCLRPPGYTTRNCPAGRANAAKYLGGEAGFKACQTAIMTHGGYRLRQGISRRALLARKHDTAHRSGHAASDSLLHRRESSGAAEIVLRIVVVDFGFSDGITRFTMIGRRLQAVGANAEAARLIGIDINRYRVVPFVLNGLAAAFVGLLFAARIGAVLPNAMAGMELTVITAAILGGTSLFGGSGNVLKSVAGVVVIYSLINGFDILGLGTSYQGVIEGVVLIIAAAIYTVGRRRRYS